MQRLEVLFQRVEGLEAHAGNTEDVLEEDEDEYDEDDNLELPANYMPDIQPVIPAAPDHTPAEPYDDIPDIPRADALKNPYVRVVHTNGIHHIALVFCTCQGREATHGDLMAERLIPTSFTRYHTVFTHAVLDDYRLANLECKASAYQYYQKLCHQTSSIFPDSIPNLYHKLRRMSQLWR
jgi:hypothetical protein